MRAPGWVRLPWSGLREAARAVEQSEQEQVEADKLVMEVRRLHSENRITSRVHRAMRGGHA